MKKPLLNHHERQLLNTDTLAGAGYRVNIAVAKLRRELYREYGFFRYYSMMAENKIRRLFGLKKIYFGGKIKIKL